MPKHQICALIAGVGGHALRGQKKGGDLLIAFGVLHVLGFSTFWGPTPWVYLGESFPLRVRAKCIALGAGRQFHLGEKAVKCLTKLKATNWIWNFLLGYFAPRYETLSRINEKNLTMYKKDCWRNWSIDLIGLLRNANLWILLRLFHYP
jgi:hypothetical protein